MNDNVWEVRPPWPDEIPRLKEHFGLTLERPDFTLAWMWVITAGRQQRLTGLFQLLERSDGAAGFIDFTVRSRWADHQAARKAFDEILEKARALGMPAVVTQADPTGSIAAMLKGLGFATERTRETWMLSIQGGLRNTVALTGRLKERYPAEIVALAEDNLPAVAALCSKLGLLHESRVSLSGENAFDPALSFVLKKDGRVAAVFLCRMVNRLPYIEVMAQQPGDELAFPAGPTLLFREFLLAAENRGYVQALCTIQPSLTPGLSKLTKRADGKRLACYAGFERRLGENV